MDYNFFSLISEVQIIRFRKYFIQNNGKNDFWKYEHFDVIYKEYFFTGTILFIIVFLINLIFFVIFSKSLSIIQNN